MKRIEFYPKTQTVVVYLDENIKDKREAYTKAWKELVKEVIKNDNIRDNPTNR